MSPQITHGWYWYFLLRTCALLILLPSELCTIIKGHFASGCSIFLLGMLSSQNLVTNNNLGRNTVSQKVIIYGSFLLMRRNTHLSSGAWQPFGPDWCLLAGNKARVCPRHEGGRGHDRSRYFPGRSSRFNFPSTSAQARTNGCWLPGTELTHVTKVTHGKINHRTRQNVDFGTDNMDTSKKLVFFRSLYFHENRRFWTNFLGNRYERKTYAWNNPAHICLNSSGLSVRYHLAVNILWQHFPVKL